MKMVYIVVLLKFEKINNWFICEFIWSEYTYKTYGVRFGNFFLEHFFTVSNEENRWL